MQVIGRDGSGSLDATITNNDSNRVDTTFDPGTSDFPLSAIILQSHETTMKSTTHFHVRADVRGNTVPLGPNFDLLGTSSNWWKARPPVPAPPWSWSTQRPQAPTARLS